ncbi:MAG: polyprenyl synthetase family protein [Sandaracinaceae bacterium]
MGLPHVRDDGSADRMRVAVEGHLRAFFALKRERVASLAPEGVALLDAVADLTLRGGKRVRPVLLGAAFSAVAPERDPTDVIAAAASLELLQSYLLIHDDWMDGDAVRRGGEAVHAAFSSQYGPSTGASLAILAGNLASTFAWELLFESSTASRSERCVEVFHRMHREVVVGQQLDLLGGPDVSRMHRLKTGSYTVRGPLDLGALLGGASEEQRVALTAFGGPLGEAFQVRDDLLGVFGDPLTTGKPAADLRSGRHTALLAAATELPDAEQHVLSLARTPEASLEQLAAARAVLERSGVRRTVEAKLEALLMQAAAALEGAPLTPTGIDQLTCLASRLAVRAA